MGKLIKLNALLVKVQYSLLSLIFILMIILMITQVVFRYFLELPLSWSEEVARYIFIVVTYIGATIAIAERTHIEINVTEVIYKKIGLNIDQKLKVDLILEMVASFIILIITSLFTFYCFIYALEDYHFQQTSTALGIPLYLVSGSISLSMFLMAFHSFVQFMVHSREILFGGQEQNPRHDMI